jgi:hypothetical protein
MANSACSGLVRAARLRSAQRWVLSMAARPTLSRAVAAMHSSSTIMMSEPMAVCIWIELSGVS